MFLFGFFAQQPGFSQSDGPLDSCSSDFFAYNEPGGWHHTATSVYGNHLVPHIQSLPPGILQDRLQLRADEIYAYYLNLSSGYFDFTNGLNTCIRNIVIDGINTLMYTDQVLSESHLMITHATFGYSDFLTIWHEINLMTNDINGVHGDDKTIVITTVAKDKEEDSPPSSADLAKHWPKFRGDWDQRSPKYIVNDNNGTHNINYNAGEITLIGGRFSVCLKESMYSLLLNVNQGKTSAITMHLPMYAIGTTDFKNVEDEYAIRPDTWDFLDYVNDALAPTIGFPRPPIFIGDEDSFHIITVINQTEVERKGGDPTASGVRTVTLHFITKNPLSIPSLPNLSVTEFNENKNLVTFSVINNGLNSVRYPEDVTYSLVDASNGFVYETGKFDNFTGIVGSTASAEWFWDPALDWPVPDQLMLVLDPNGIHYETDESDNTDVISPGW